MKAEDLRDCIELLACVQNQNNEGLKANYNYLKSCFEKLNPMDSFTLAESEVVEILKARTVDASKVMILGKKLNKVLSPREKLFLNYLLLQAAENGIVYSTLALESVSICSSIFGINNQDFLQMKNFVINHDSFSYYDSQLVTVTEKEPPVEQKIYGYRFIIRDKLNASLFFRVDNKNGLCIFKSFGNNPVFINGKAQLLPGMMVPVVSEDEFSNQNGVICKGAEVLSKIEEKYFLSSFRIPATSKSPEVVFDLEQNLISLKGKSNPEDAFNFYQPLLIWIDHYCSTSPKSTKVELQLEFFNTPSSRLILDLLTKFKKPVSEGKEVKIRWHYHEDDEDLEEAGKSYAYILGLPVEIVAHN